ncbi:MAG: PTS sugar transporter subunit IIA [Oscillospiraceae bacterium]|nr:PTS sugar transporter subunit IIA [Oscillospiraceae bacterium]
MIHDGFQRDNSAFNRKIADDLTARLEKRYITSIPKEEQEYLQLCISISEIQNFTDPSSRQTCETEESDLFELVKRYIAIVSKMTGINLQTDRPLCDDLFLYLRSAVRRLQYGILMPNPLLPQVKAEYPNLFTVAWSASVLIEEEMHVEVSENEVGFLTIYIAGAVERANSTVQACILCNYGVGVSQLLKAQIERSIPNLSVSAVATFQDAEKVRNNGCDFVITPEEIGQTFGGKDVVTVNNFLIPYDIKKIKEKIFEIRRKKISRVVQEDDYHHIQLFDSNFIQFPDSTFRKEGLLEEMCRSLEHMGYISSEFLGSVQKREKAASTYIGKGVAIPHGSTKFVVRPIISVAILKEPILWNDGELADFIFLLALKPNHTFSIQSQVMRFYTVLSNLMDNDKKLNDAKNIKSKTEFADYMNRLTQ